MTYEIDVVHDSVFHPGGVADFMRYRYLVALICGAPTIFLGIAYSNGTFSPSYRGSIEMTKPVPIAGDVASANLLAKEFTNENDKRTVQELSRVLSKGLTRNNTGKVYATFSAVPFDKEYDDLKLKLFPEADSFSSLIFLYTARNGQIHLRVVCFDISEKFNTFTRTFTVRSPMPADRILVLFWSDKDISNAKLMLTNEKVGP